MRDGRPFGCTSLIIYRHGTERGDPPVRTIKLSTIVNMSGAIPMSMVVYADFTNPDCYLATRRCDALAAAGVPVDFRAVEHRPDPTVIDQDAVTERFRVLQHLLLPGEQLPWTRPPRISTSEAAASAYAAVSDTPVAGEVRRLLYELYWRDGIDIGNPNLLRTPLAGPVLRSGSAADPLRQTGYAVHVDRGPVTTAAYRRIRAWRTEWQELGSPALPKRRRNNGLRWRAIQ